MKTLACPTVRIALHVTVVWFVLLLGAVGTSIGAWEHILPLIIVGVAAFGVGALVVTIAVFVLVEWAISVIEDAEDASANRD